MGHWGTLFFLLIVVLLSDLNAGLLITHAIRPQNHLQLNAAVAPLTVPITTKHEGTVLSSSLLIAGTTIGGGFLALPRATAPIGFFPAALGLLLSWFYLLSSAFSLVDATLLTKRRVSEMNDKTPIESQQTVSVFRIARIAFGTSAAKAIGITFSILMVSTLVAQLSKSGTLLAEILPAVSPAGALDARGAYTLVFALLMAAVTFSGGVAMAEKANGLLTAVMLTSFGAVTLSAAPVFQATRLLRANWPSLLPSLSSSWSIPVLLQLLVYSETVPFVVERLNGDRSKVRTAIALGSFIPLIMCLVWTAAALGAVPFSASAFDPVQTLLSTNLAPLAGSNALRSSILFLAGSAIATTVIGSLLTMVQFLQDACNLNSLPDGWRRSVGKVGIKTLALAPCALTAACGSPGLYYYMTAFAGMFPVTVLWGLFPPLAFLRLQRMASAGGESDGLKSNTLLDRALATVNVVISCFMLLTNLLTVIIGVK